MYEQICNQYQEMVDNIKDLEESYNNGEIELERLEQYKEYILPLKQNYERWAYIMYLLKKPLKEENEPAYKKRNQRLLTTLDKSNSVENTLAENEQIIKRLNDKA